MHAVSGDHRRSEAHCLQPSAKTAAALPKADFLAITWTAAEAGAMAVVLGGGKYSFKTPADNNLTPLLIPGLPIPSEAKFHGYFFQANVNGKSVVCLKSEFHPKLETAATTLFLEKILGPAASPNIKYLITSGTSGGIWQTLDVGDVVVTNSARYGLTGTVEKQTLRFTGTANITGAKPPGYATWYDYVNDAIIKNDDCVNTGLLTPGGRNAGSGKPAIYYKASGADPTTVVSNSRISDAECTRIATYRTMGATLDENDAYVAEACKAVKFPNWVSIRNVSDLPCSKNTKQYDVYQFCSSINGAYAVWAFVMGH